MTSLALAKGTNSMTFYAGNFLATTRCLQSSARHSSLRIFRKVVALTLSSAMTISRKANNYRVITAAVPNAKDEKEKKRRNYTVIAENVAVSVFLWTYLRQRELTSSPPVPSSQPAPHTRMLICCNKLPHEIVPAMQCVLQNLLSRHLAV